MYQRLIAAILLDEGSDATRQTRRNPYDILGRILSFGVVRLAHRVQTDGLLVNAIEHIIDNIPDRFRIDTRSIGSDVE